MNAMEKKRQGRGRAVLMGRQRLLLHRGPSTEGPSEQPSEGRRWGRISWVVQLYRVASVRAPRRDVAEQRRPGTHVRRRGPMLEGPAGMVMLWALLSCRAIL